MLGSGVWMVKMKGGYLFAGYLVSYVRLSSIYWLEHAVYLSLFQVSCMPVYGEFVSMFLKIFVN